MMPWILAEDMLRTIEERTVRAARYAPHRADLYRRPGRFLASLADRMGSRHTRKRRAVPPRSVTSTPEARMTLTVIAVRETLTEPVDSPAAMLTAASQPTGKQPNRVFAGRDHAGNPST